MWNVPLRLKKMGALAVDVEVLSIVNPWLSYIPKRRASGIARSVNAELASIVKKQPKRFAALALVPITSDEVLEEMDYAVNNLQLRGFMIGTHVNGKSILSDEFFPIFQRAAKLGVPIFIHPLAQPDALRYLDRVVASNLIFPTETALFARESVNKRLFQRCPKLKVVLAHLGGTVPFLFGRLERSLLGVEQTKGILSLIKSFYLDSVTYFTPSLEHAAKIWGADKIMFGTDFPHAWSDSLERTAGVIQDSELSAKEKDLVFAENAKKIFRL
jgi:predicted TIM-barrel fold metal-dependent hydrolase